MPADPAFARTAHSWLSTGAVSFDGGATRRVAAMLVRLHEPGEWMEFCHRVLYPRLLGIIKSVENAPHDVAATRAAGIAVRAALHAQVLLDDAVARRAQARNFLASAGDANGHHPPRCDDLILRELGL